VREGAALRAGSVGPALPLTEIQIVDVETGTRVLPTGERGEIRARGPQIMSGYRNRPRETAEALRGGWLYTGDIGELDADGWLYIRDRKKDMAIVGGYNVYPREVDEVLFAHPDVKEAACAGVPDPYYGEAIRAYVVLKPGARASADDLLAHCKANLARYKVPGKIYFVAELPRTTVGKVDRIALRQKLAAEA
jgi:long-chain acyl-CoA synthetase